MQPSHTNELAESIAQFEAAWSAMSRDFPDVEQVQLPGLNMNWPDVSLAFYNVALVTGEVADPADLTARAERALAYMRTKEHPGFLVICEDLLSPTLREQVVRLLASANFMPVMPITGMAASGLTPPSRPVQAVPLRRANGRADAQLITDLNCRAYGIPIEVGRTAVTELLLHDECHAFIAEAESQPVACTATFPIEGRLYVALVATLPDHQRRGYADAVMRASLQSCAAATGLTRTILHATDAGRSVYRRMGYHDTAKFTLYAQPIPAH